jgi:hypothetical protein
MIYVVLVTVSRPRTCSPRFPDSLALTLVYSLGSYIHEILPSGGVSVAQLSAPRPRPSGNEMVSSSPRSANIHPSCTRFAFILPHLRQFFSFFLGLSSSLIFLQIIPVFLVLFFLFFHRITMADIPPLLIGVGGSVVYFPLYTLYTGSARQIYGSTLLQTA